VRKIPPFRDSMLAPKHPQAALLVRLGASDLRQLRFVSALLMRLKAEGRRPAEGVEAPKVSGYPTISLKSKGLKMQFGDIPRCH
jgi:hypothetical protein